MMSDRAIFSLKCQHFYCLAILVFISYSGYAQGINQNWERDLNTEMKEFMSCENANLFGISSCNKYLGHSLKTVYNVNDFYSEKLKRYMRVVEISAYLKKSDKWQFLGYAYDQNALSKAQENANNKKATVAVYLGGDGLGHIALILPGQVKPSGSWGYFKVPNSSSFFLNEPKSSFIGKGLSYSFKKSLIKNVLIYGRKH